MVIQYVHVTGEKQILTVWSSGNASRSVDSKKVVTCVDVEGPAYQYQKKKTFKFCKKLVSLQFQFVLTFISVDE